MKKKEQGVLTVEASIVLTLITLFILFLFSFARMYSAQSMVSHAVLQASDAVAIESYIRETALNGSETDVVELANRLTGSTSISLESFTSLRSADLPKIVRQKFVAAIDNSEIGADNTLKKLGIKDGLSGVDFSSSRIDLNNNDVIVYANYTIEMQFPVFGMKEVTVSKAAKSKTFGEILFDIQTIAENPIMGSASGGGNYKHGTQIQISATPNYGYKFKQWADGSVENPRTVTVSGAKTYIAIFEQSEFGVNLVANPADGGSVSGAGTYKYLNNATITATPSTGYHFDRWYIHKHKDNAGNTIRGNATTSLTVDQSYTCTAYFQPNQYTVTVKTQGVSSGAYITYNRSTMTSLTANYKDSFKITAPNINGYRFIGWKEQGSGSYFNSSSVVSLTVPARNVTYLACYESTVKTVRFYGYNGQLYATRTVNAGKSLGNNMPGNPYYRGLIFNGWQNGFSRNTVVNSDMNVYSNWRGCSGHRAGDCGVVHGISGTKLSSHSINSQTIECMCIVCVDCGSYLRHNGRNWYASSGMWWRGGNMEMSPSVWCVRHKTGSCDSYRRNNSAGTYPVHGY